MMTMLVLIRVYYDFAFVMIPFIWRLCGNVYGMKVICM